MNMFLKFREQSKFSRFFIVGLFCFLVSLGSLILLTDFFGVQYLVATAIVFVVVNFLSFLSQKKFTFVSFQGLFIPSLMRYYGVMGLSLLGNVLGMHFLVENVGLSVALSSTLLSLLLLGVNYMLHDFFTFRS